MKTGPAPSPQDHIAPKHIRAQAALWVTDLHGPQRTEALEVRWRQWMTADPRHAAAFELATDAWLRSGPVPSHTGALHDTQGAPCRRRSVPMVAAVACGLAVLGLYTVRGGVQRTGAGEQRILSLSDGSKVTLSARTELEVQFDRHVRRVTLTEGEALFEVAHREARPFVVSIGSKKVVAVGTMFDVRRDQGDGSSYTVTLLEGQVAVAPQGVPDALPAASPPGVTLMNPGQRLRLFAGSAPELDRPALDRVLAWRQGQLVFDAVSLREAAAEFNRYGATPIRIAGAVPARYAVGGVFRIADPASFADAMANTYPLRVTHHGHELILEPR